MCGIAGVVGPGAEQKRIDAMRDTLRHRGPDGEGTWCSDGIALGHTRLKIIDLSEQGRQPMESQDGRYVIVFNGEVYNYRELRSELADIPFRSQTDTEVVLEAWARWGQASLERLVGMFAFAVWDKREHCLTLVRDRLGIKPLYYAQSNQGLLFGSEIRALLAGGLQARENPQAIYDFLAREWYDHTDTCFFAGVRCVPPASWQVWNAAGSMVQSGVYWSLGERVHQVEVPATRAGRESRLMELLARAVSSHLVADVPVGLALSAGLDSATLLALVSSSVEERLQVFSFDSNDPNYSERPYVEALIAHTGHSARFTECRAEEFAAVTDRLTVEQEQPFAGAPIYAYAQLHRAIAGTGIKVVMDGSGLDECLAGYTRFLPARWADLQAHGQLEELELELAAAGAAEGSRRERAEAQMLAAAGGNADEGVGQDLTRSVRPECLSPELVEQCAHTRISFDRPFPDALRNLMFRELRYTKLPRALRFRDRLSMACGLELRPPFLDHRVLEYCFALPPEDLIERGLGKMLLRTAAASKLPDVVRLASKRSVQTPQREWFRGELSGWIRDSIYNSSLWERGWLDRSQATAAAESFLRGEGDNSFFLWQWINLERWASLVLRQPVGKE